MPSLVKFLTVCCLIVSTFLGSLYILATHFEPEQKEVIKPIRNIEPRYDLG